MKELSGIRGLLLDMDGVIYRGDTPLPGARELFAFMRTVGIDFAMITNNATRTGAEYVEKLARMGIAVQESEVLPVGKATADYLAENAAAGSRVFVVGQNGLKEPLRKAGFVVTDDRPQYVVVGLDVDFNYEKLSIACRAIRNGAGFIASNRDATYPVENALLPGSGALVAAIEVCTGEQPLVIGKPEPTMLRAAMDRLGLAPEEVAMVGDRLETDIIAGWRAGTTTILVLTGVTSREEAEDSMPRPDYVFQVLIALREALEKSR